MGFDAYDYVPGKADWISADWETERSPDSSRRAGDAVEREVPTCGPTDTVDKIAPVVERSGRVLVVNEARILLGRVGSHQLHDTAPDAPAESVMEPGPATVRIVEPLIALRERMARAKVAEIVVTTADGELLGVVAAKAP